MKFVLLISLFAALLFGVLFYAAMGSRVSVNKGEIQEDCLADVKAAQESFFDKICTQEMRLLSCPKDPFFTYEASNGCEISSLVESGWK